MMKTVVMIQVREGNRKPFLVKGKGVYVRVGATDRVANRDELVSLVTNRSGL